jgi:hypothetical protein
MCESLRVQKAELAQTLPRPWHVTPSGIQTFALVSAWSVCSRQTEGPRSVFTTSYYYNTSSKRQPNHGACM